MWLGGALLSALLMITAGLAEAHPLTGMALVLPAAAALLWYGIRYVD